MKKSLILIPILFVSLILKAQTPKNLDFEIIENNKAKDWAIIGSEDYSASIDSITVKSGNYAGMLSSNDKDANVKAWAYTIPANFEGGQIKLTGYIKTENVSSGHAGVWMRLDPNIGADIMEDKGITGTTDWKKYEITLDLTRETESITIGGILVGKGKMWVDDLEITINGNPIEEAKQKEPSLADKDNEFNNGSNITISKLNKNSLANLAFLGRVWGFLKYYHPEAAKGNINWDYELFRVLPNYLKVKNIAERDAVILRWIEGLDEIPPCKSCKPVNKEAFITPDLEWLNGSDVSKKLSDNLSYIKNNRFQGKHYYVRANLGVDNSVFTNERIYTDIPKNDQGFKLLAVYRYWNMVQYFFPYKHKTDQDWNTVLPEMITKIMQATNDVEYHLTLLEMAIKIDDSHGRFSTPELKDYFGTNQVPFKFKIIDNQLIVTKLINKDLAVIDDVKVGDVIKTINGTTVSKLLKDYSKYIWASNPSVKKRNSKHVIFKGNNDSVAITFERDGKTNSKVIKKSHPDKINAITEKQKKWKILENNIGYIDMGLLKIKEVKGAMEDLKNTKGIIFDIRNYPNGTWGDISKYLNTNAVEFVKFTIPDFSYPGTFIWTDNYRCGGGAADIQYKGKVVIIVDETTQSHAEYTTMALQTAKDAVVVGSQTSGADGNVSDMPMVRGHSAGMTGIGVYYPDGKETQRIGIVPDIKVLPTIKGIRAGIDEPLEKAIEVINSK